MKIILGFTGEIGSGKGSACQYIIDKYGASVHKTSVMLRDLLQRLHLEHSRENMANLSTSLRQIFNEDIMARVMFEDVRKDDHEMVAIDGVRLLVDVAYLKKFPEFKLIHISAPIKTRYDRIVKRQQNPDEATKTFEEFEADQKLETESHYADLHKMADYVINNDGTVEEFYQKIDEVIDEVRNMATPK